MAGKIFIGTSGWNYRHWGNETFYPRDLSPKDWLPFYARHFSTVELNSTFYRLPSKEVFSHWTEQAPDRFIFAVKASQFITHSKRLKEPEQSVKRFLSHLSGLGKKRGPVLFQLPPQMKVDSGRLRGLIDCLKEEKRLRVALEIRHESWLAEEVFGLLDDAGWTICLADWPDFGCEIPVLGPFCYIRRHGTTALYGGGYSDEQLAEDAKLTMRLAKQGKDVYIYFNNDAEGYAVKNARTVMRMIEPIQRFVREIESFLDRKDRHAYYSRMAKTHLATSLVDLGGSKELRGEIHDLFEEGLLEPFVIAEQDVHGFPKIHEAERSTFDIYRSYGWLIAWLDPKTGGAWRRKSSECVKKQPIALRRTQDERLST